jgi:beta-N-acetylhexosaminidase
MHAVVGRADRIAAVSDLEANVDTCFMITIPGTGPVPPESARWLEQGVGSVIVLGANVASREQAAEFIADIRSYSPDVLIAADEEGGDVTRFERNGGSSYPGNLALGTVDDLELTHRVAGSIADMIAEYGVDIACAPAVDVNTNPDNPVIGPRSFGAEPDLVSRHGLAVIEELQKRGIAACAKHFPGHGATSQDSHYDLPTVDRPRPELDDIEFAPFKAAIAAGVKTVMAAHIIYPVLDDKPASISRPILTGLLREEMGFTGAILTDGFGMAAISEGIGLERGTVEAFAAGIDMICATVDYPAQQAMRRAVIDAVHNGQLSEDRMAEAAARIRELRAWCRPAPLGAPDPEIGLAAARRAVVVDAAGLPLSSVPYVIDAGLRVRPGIGVTSVSLRDMLGANGVTLADPPEDPAAIVAAAGAAPLVVTVRDAHTKPWQAELVAAAVSSRPDCIVVGTGTPYDRMLAPGRYIGALGCARPNLQAVAELLLGKEFSSQR